MEIAFFVTGAIVSYVLLGKHAEKLGRKHARKKMDEEVL